MLPTILLSTCLLLVAAGLMTWHWQAWKAVRDHAAESTDRDFAWSQFRRRAQASAMMGLLAVFMLGSLWIERMAPWGFAVYIIAMLVLIAWVVLLALADMIATRQHFAHAQIKNLAEQARLQGELVRLQEEAQGDPSTGNGKAH
ncbi:MAG: hypothetical protein MI757_03770 [Pirellulales bacterium]|nr:hypothetical protein [Pirellulales bacterium]